MQPLPATPPLNTPKPEKSLDENRAVSDLENQQANASAKRRWGLSAVSATVFGAGRRLQLALTVFGRAGRLDISPQGPVAALMTEAPRSLGAELHRL